MDNKEKSPACGSRASNVLKFTADKSNNRAHSPNRQGLPAKPPSQNSLIRWERAMAYRRIYEKEGTLASLTAYEQAMSDFASSFNGGAA